MLVQKFLQEGGTLSDLETRYAIKTSRSRRYPYLVLLKYDQIESPFAEPLVQECRGLVLDESDQFRVISRSFDKFFNYGEGHAAKLDWSTAKVQEKLDGSLCVLYFYQGEWHVQTSGAPDASGKVNSTAYTFSSLFWETWQNMGYLLPSESESQLCFAFELMTPWNRVVTHQRENRLLLIGVRNRETGEQFPVALYQHRFQVVPSFPLQSLDDILASFLQMNPLQQEGYVVVDQTFRRVKVKHPGYVALHHLRDGFSSRRMMEVIQAGEVAEVLVAFPEWTEKFKEAQTRFASLQTELEDAYEKLKSIPNQKDFALAAVKTRLPAALFAMRAGKTPSIRMFLAQHAAERLLEVLKLEIGPLAGV